MFKSEHQLRVENFMLRAQQQVPISPEIPSEKIRYLRARLILEEAKETVEALGFICEYSFMSPSADDPRRAKPISLIEIADGCCDLIVVTTGTLSSCGLSDTRLQEIVDTDNLKKFKPGYSLSSEGKLIKPPTHVGPTSALEYEIENQRCYWKD